MNNLTKIFVALFIVLGFIRLKNFSIVFPNKIVRYSVMVVGLIVGIVTIIMLFV
ncbi:hypothetical protein GOQ27_14105 [Clostridium sp. D2Q-11]|uniref:Uncharacterized protein n=1 Tax=Anaeromonas frigoriresistens TaxID=2683708 RepID=A0A942Z9R7_9FIRM|nr:hypothetical protein [Anaeromonas frigoriresistens]MBS4539603.1 hypothetical protein [Anaeromonas frigoriresistens]